MDLFIDGERIARLAVKESITLYVAPGRHLVGARFPGAPPTEREFLTDERNSSRLRILADPVDVKPESGNL